ncbi:MAG: metalloregulator ArsR/SmtB family transcription factor [Bacteroidota bacterium]
MSTEARRDVFQAIADPNRREMIRLLANQSMNLNAIAEKFDISRPAVSQHIKILTECGLIIIKQKGRERHCEAKLEALNEVANWVDQYKQFWTDNLNSLDQYLKNIQSKSKK